MKLADNYNPRFKKIPDTLIDDYINSVYSLKTKSGDVHEGYFKEMYGRLKTATEGGYGKAFTDFDNLKEFELFQRMGINMSRFTAYRMQSLNAALISELYDLKGTKLSKADFDLKAKKVIRRYNNYLKTEVRTARRRAMMAEKWVEFESRADVYPNVKFVTRGDDLVRDTHRVLNGIIRPINDPFWKTHRPPLAWNCRCNVVQTDDDVTDIPDDAGTAQVQKGFESDVVTGQLFGDKHPYFTNVKDPSVVESLDSAAKILRSKFERPIIQDLAKTALVEKSMQLVVPNLPKPMVMTSRDVRNVFVHFHIQPDVKNALVLALPMIVKELQFLKVAVNDDPAKPTTTNFYYYQWAFMDMLHYFNIREVVSDGSTLEYKLYMIGSQMR